MRLTSRTIIPVALLALIVGVGALALGARTSTPDLPEQPEQEPVAEPEEPEESTPTPEATASFDASHDAAVQALSARLGGMRQQLYVYRDFSDSENHFSQRMMLFGESDTAALGLNEAWTDNPHGGKTCIRCEHDTSALSWSGWMFVNGYVPEGATEPVINDETPASRGIDLTGATELRLWARGENGGEVVDFFCGGFGYDGSGRVKAQDNADSMGTQALRNVRLTDEWQEYVIPLDDADLTNIACGFGYAINDVDYRHQEAIFYLDDIRFVGPVDAQQDAPMLLRSYDTDAKELSNAAYTYDNALAAMAFLSEGRTDEAATVLDALVYGVEHDRFAPGRIRNAYAAGEVIPPAGWGENAKLPGWYDAEARSWYEDAYQVGSNVGNTSYAALALMHYASEVDDPERAERYLATARQLMDWVIDDCSDERDGFLAGYDGWPENGPDGATVHTYKSTEHNIDAYAAFTELYELTGTKRYRKAARSARRFVESMYDEKRGCFLTGTQADGVTPDAGNIVLDAQVWSALALGDDFAPYETALEQLDGMRTSTGGYRFHVCDEDAYWCEGTAFTALMHRLRGDDAEADAAFNALAEAQLESGMLPAGTADDVSTGIYLADGSPWLYGTDPHVAPTAWLVMAGNGYNPYTFA